MRRSGSVSERRKSKITWSIGLTAVTGRDAAHDLLVNLDLAFLHERLPQAVLEEGIALAPLDRLEFLAQRVALRGQFRHVRGRVGDYLEDEPGVRKTQRPHQRAVRLHESVSHV